MNPPPPPAPPQAGNYSNAISDYSNTAATAQAALQQQHVPTASAQAAATANGRKRKASGVPGSRGVANLTPEQLAKKRANDREAQRAIRERTRNTIEGLERRIRELESQQPYQDLQRVMRERDSALQECENLRRKLATVANLAGGEQAQQQQQAAQQQQQPNLHGMSDNMFDEFLDPAWLTDDTTELAALTAQQSPLPPLQQHAQGQNSPGASQQQFGQQMLGPDLRSPHASSQAGASSRTGTPTTSYPSEATPLRRWSPSNEHDSPAQYTSNGVSYDSRRQQQGLHVQNNGERLGVNFLLDQNRSTGTPPPGSHPQHRNSSHHRKTDSFSTSWATRLPNNGPYTCPLDSLLGDFVANRRKLLAEGVPMHEVIGPEDPSFTGLSDGGPQRRSTSHPISALLVDILSKFPDISDIPEKVSVLHMMFLLLRWEICPCEACYTRLPDWLRPTVEQLERPHPAWYDHCPWPLMRSRLITGPHVNFEEFFIPFTSTLSVNWPYASDHVLMEDPSDPSQLKMNPAFENHLRDVRHWTLGTPFREAFPQLVEQVGIRDVKQ